MFSHRRLPARGRAGPGRRRRWSADSDAGFHAGVVHTGVVQPRAGGAGLGEGL